MVEEMEVVTMVEEMEVVAVVEEVKVMTVVAVLIISKQLVLHLFCPWQCLQLHYEYVDHTIATRDNIKL